MHDPSLIGRLHVTLALLNAKKKASKRDESSTSLLHGFSRSWPLYRFADSGARLFLTLCPGITILVRKGLDTLFPNIFEAPSMYTAFRTYVPRIARTPHRLSDSYRPTKYSSMGLLKTPHDRIISHFEKDRRLQICQW